MQAYLLACICAWYTQSCMCIMQGVTSQSSRDIRNVRRSYWIPDFHCQIGSGRRNYWRGQISVERRHHDGEDRDYWWWPTSLHQVGGEKGLMVYACALCIHIPYQYEQVCETRCLGCWHGWARAERVASPTDGGLVLYVHHKHTFIQLFILCRTNERKLGRDWTSPRMHRLIRSMNGCRCHAMDVGLFYFAWWRWLMLECTLTCVFTG